MTFPNTGVGPVPGRGYLALIPTCKTTMPLGNVTVNTGAAEKKCIQRHTAEAHPWSHHELALVTE